MAWEYRVFLVNLPHGSEWTNWRRVRGYEQCDWFYNANQNGSRFAEVGAIEHRKVKKGRKHG